MNSIITRKALSSTSRFAGRNWYYEFRTIQQLFEEEKCEALSAKLSNRFSKLTKSWSEEKNSEWLCRIYLSAKMVMAATLQLTGLQYANDRNMRLVSPYLSYYSILSLLRAVVYTLPEVEWNGGKLVTISHQKAVNLAFDHLAQFDPELAEKHKRSTLELKAARELISYWSPSSGDANLPSQIDVEALATLLAEISQFNSEIMEASIIKHADDTKFVFLPAFAETLSTVTLEGLVFFDREDAYRLGYLARKYPVPPNVQHVMTEGHVEDFFGAWVSEEESEELFDPDANWQLIFDIP